MPSVGFDSLEPHPVTSHPCLPSAGISVVHHMLGFLKQNKTEQNRVLGMELRSSWWQSKNVTDRDWPCSHNQSQPLPRLMFLFACWTCRLNPGPLESTLPLSCSPPPLTLIQGPPGRWLLLYVQGMKPWPRSLSDRPAAQEL